MEWKYSTIEHDKGLKNWKFQHTNSIKNGVFFFVTFSFVLSYITNHRTSKSGWKNQIILQFSIRTKWSYINPRLVWQSFNLLLQFSIRTKWSCINLRLVWQSFNLLLQFSIRTKWSCINPRLVWQSFNLLPQFSIRTKWSCINHVWCDSPLICYYSSLSEPSDHV
jgi:hypothetical protein